MEWIYVVEFVGSNAYKIGFTTGDDPYKRINTFKTYAPAGINVELLVKTKNGRALERKLHEKFKNKRVRKNAEFFELSKLDIDLIKNEYNQSQSRLEHLLSDVLSLYDTKEELIFDLKTLINKKSKQSKTDNIVDKDRLFIKNYLIENFSGEFMTTTEIMNECNHLSVLEKYNLNTFGGKILRKIFTRRAKRRKGSNQVWGYLIE